jgi:hypothetical protein
MSGRSSKKNARYSYSVLVIIAVVILYDSFSSFFVSCFYRDCKNAVSL